MPCLSVFQGFPGGDTTQAANYGPASGSACPGPLLSTNIFGLQVPNRFVVPNTQQWNLTVQRSLGKQWVLEVGYVGTHAVHLRETRDSLQAQNATPANPVEIDNPTYCNPNPCMITANTFNNAVARSLVQGINGYAGFQLFADDAYSHYHSLQTTLSRRWGAGYFQAAYTFSTIDGCDFLRQYGVQYGVQRRVHARGFAWSFGLRSHSPVGSQLSLRVAVLQRRRGCQEGVY